MVLLGRIPSNPIYTFNFAEEAAASDSRNRKHPRMNDSEGCPMGISSQFSGACSISAVSSFMEIIDFRDSYLWQYPNLVISKALLGQVSRL